jgi:hypothetical protein
MSFANLILNIIDEINVWINLIVNLVKKENKKAI